MERSCVGQRLDVPVGGMHWVGGGRASGAGQEGVPQERTLVDQLAGMGKLPRTGTPRQGGDDRGVLEMPAISASAPVRSEEPRGCHGYAGTRSLTGGSRAKDASKKSPADPRAADACLEGVLRW